MQTPIGVLTGAYRDSNCADKHLWAAAELARTTGKEIYAKYFEEHYRDFTGPHSWGDFWGDFAKLWSDVPGGRRTSAIVRATDPQDWRNVANLGLWSYVLGEGRNTEVAAAIREASLKAADEIVTRTAGLGY